MNIRKACELFNQQGSGYKVQALDMVHACGDHIWLGENLAPLTQPV